MNIWFGMCDKVYGHLVWYVNKLVKQTIVIEFDSHWIPQISASVYLITASMVIIINTTDAVKTDMLYKLWFLFIAECQYGAKIQSTMFIS